MKKNHTTLGVRHGRRRLLRGLSAAAAVLASNIAGLSQSGGMLSALTARASDAAKKIAKLPFHHAKDGFRNNYIGQINKPFVDLMKWRRESPGHPLLSFPLAQNNPIFLRDNRTQNTITWVGHATLLVQMNGVNILTDPHFSERASPFSFVGPQRGTPPGIAMADLPPVDVVLISHNHYDHLDEDSILQLARANPAAQFFCPLRLGGFLRECGARHITELDWWQEVSPDFAGGDLKITALPCQHWSSRFPWDRNRSLWAAWAVERGGKRFLFVGDTGYSADFVDIGVRIGGFDWAAIPIGAYQPRWFMKQAHINPDEAARIFGEVKAKQAVAIHWGTFRLTDEPMDEPPQKLRETVTKHGITQFHVFRHGETRDMDVAS